MSRLVLSTFPGIDMFGAAFAEVFGDEICLVRGPDLIYGSLHDMRTFHAPASAFWGILSSPPCQQFSQLRYLQEAQGRTMRFGNLIPEFERIVAEAQPEWFLMENVPAAPVPEVPGYVVHSYRINNRWVPDAGGIGAEQSRLRVFSFGTHDGRALCIEAAIFEAPLSEPTQLTYPVSLHQRPAPPQAVLSSTRAVPVRIGGSGKVKVTAPGAVSSAHGSASPRSNARLPRAPGAVTSSDGGTSVRMSRYSVAEAAALQGLPLDFLDDAPFTSAGKLKAIAQGVPMALGRAIAAAVRRAMQEVAADGAETLPEQASA